MNVEEFEQNCHEISCCCKQIFEFFTPTTRMIKYGLPYNLAAQSAGALKYTDCISAEG